jgi:hypothetical protein
MSHEGTPFEKFLIPTLVMAMPVVAMVMWFVIDAQLAAK